MSESEMDKRHKVVAGLRDAIAYAKGDVSRARVTRYDVPQSGAAGMTEMQSEWVCSGCDGKFLYAADQMPNHCPYCRSTEQNGVVTLAEPSGTDIAIGARSSMRNTARQILAIIDDLTEDEFQESGWTMQEVDALERLSKIEGIR